MIQGAEPTLVKPRPSSSSSSSSRKGANSIVEYCMQVLRVAANYGRNPYWQPAPKINAKILEKSQVVETIDTLIQIYIQFFSYISYGIILVLDTETRYPEALLYMETYLFAGE